jgi:YD repeat-containing protein
MVVNRDSDRHRLKRKRVARTSIGGQTTAYAYDLAGQLLKVTAPDASWIGYEYDAAHRLTAVKDQLGIRIDYTLDAAGSMTAQTTTNPLSSTWWKIPQRSRASGCP